MLTSDRQFRVLVSLFNSMQNAKSHDSKLAKFRKFLDLYGNPTDYFSAIRLILPLIDRERGTYGLLETVLTVSLVDALGMARDSDDAKRLINWRKGGSKVNGENAGNFAGVAVEVLQRRQSSVSAGITIGEVNALLDRLAAADDRETRVGILSELIRKTNWNEMKWIIMIILKDMKLGISEKSIFHEFHPDAEDLFNVTCDLRFVCEKLCDRNVRHRRQDIEVGKPVKPQMAYRVTNMAAAWKRLHGKEVVVECKFDGDRIMVHKNGDNVSYFSRNFINHDEFEHGMSNVIVENVLSDKCILDGEMMVWDKGSNRFADFGATQGVAKAARDGLDNEKQLCYVAFDLLYVEDTSVIHQSLKERQELLRKFVRPVKGRLKILLPSANEGLNAHRLASEPRRSIVVNSINEVEKFYKEMIDNREEGIVLKDLGSKWEPGDRSGKWIKVKPDYVRAGADLDALIIGGYYGSGRRGGEIGQFLLGIAERPSPNTYPRKFLSFCRVGTGLNDEELDELVTKLKPYFRKYEYPKKSPPSFYQVTNNSKERPDVWVESPEKSFIMSITSDIRMINSGVFAGPYSLRFPRIDRVRYDKPWHECLDVQSFIDLVNSSNGTIHRGGEAVDKPKRAKGEGRKKLSFTVPSHFLRTDVSSVKAESKVFSNMVFYFVNVPSNHSSDSLHTLVVENGGRFSMNLNDTVTHCVGAESKGIKHEATKRRGRDVIHYSWVVECCSKKQLLPLRPNHFIYLSDVTRKKLQEEIDEFSDSYFWDINIAELKQILCDVNVSKDATMVDYYKKKYCPREEWCCFHGCCVYFHTVDNFPYSDWDVFLRVSMRRMKVEVSVGGGKVVENPSEATHIVVMSLPEYDLNFETLLQGFLEDKKRLLRLKRIHVVGSQWLEDCIEKWQKLPEMVYNLKPDSLEEESSSSAEEGENYINNELLSDSSVREEPVPSKPPKMVARAREPRRKRGRPPVGPISKPPKPKRARVGKKPAKLQDIASDDEISEEEHHVQTLPSPDITPIEPPRPKRAGVRKRPAKLQETMSDDENSEQEHYVQRRTSPEIDILIPQRSKRAKGGKGKAKLREITSDDEVSEQEYRRQRRASPELDLAKFTRSKRADCGKGTAKLQEIDSNDEFIEQDHHVKPRVSPEPVLHGHVSLESEKGDNSIAKEANTLEKYAPETESSLIEPKPVSSERNMEYEVGEPKFRHGLVTCSKAGEDTKSLTSGKLEAEFDPVQAMLMSMIPGLAKTQDPIPVEDKNLPLRTQTGGTSATSNGEPVKKKKVSYKDLVNQALKD